jgi:hypothetical protein
LHAVQKFDHLDPIEPYTSKTASKMRFVEGQDRAEPTPDEMMHEPIIRLMMESDHVTEAALRRIMTSPAVIWSVARSSIRMHGSYQLIFSSIRSKFCYFLFEHD